MIYRNSLATPPALFCPRRPPLLVFESKPQFEPSKVQGNGQRILVIDDEASIADSLAEILSEYGYQALAFYDGHAAIAATREKCPDLVLCDVIMPQLNGVDTVLAIRELCSTARILLFSGQATTTDILEKARAQGHWFEVLPKPIHPNELLKRLATKKN
ncbi:MAG TPA: response regulator [Candidatus Angelobacter sp.]|nr:response regulator [Candidatus Angelobacter sp.]